MSEHFQVKSATQLLEIICNKNGLRYKVEFDRSVFTHDDFNGFKFGYSFGIFRDGFPLCRLHAEFKSEDGRMNPYQDNQLREMKAFNLLEHIFQKGIERIDEVIEKEGLDDQD